MLTENRREYLETRSSSDKAKKTEYDYRLLKWLEAMLDSGEKGGIGDLNNVLDTLERDAIRKHLKDKNIDDLLKLVERLVAILEFVPISKDKNGIEYVSQSLVIKTATGELTAFSRARGVTDEDRIRSEMLTKHIEHLKLFVEASSAIVPDPRHPVYYESMIKEAHEKGYEVIAYDRLEEIQAAIKRDELADQKRDAKEPPK